MQAKYKLGDVVEFYRDIKKNSTRIGEIRAVTKITKEYKLPSSTVIKESIYYEVSGYDIEECRVICVLN